jgi:2-oxo-4-hydroxy-4-carboxy-5-ureidoimidazoline decarboxylase
VNTAQLDAMDEATAREALTRCCGSSRWVEHMLAARPYGTPEALWAACERADARMTDADQAEAFRHHPRIGDLESLRTRFASTAAWAGREQAGASAASEATLRALAEGNAAYEARFGYLFIVCATGLTGDQMLARLQERLRNDPASEWVIACGEQARIARLRLEKLIAQEKTS